MNKKHIVLAFVMLTLLSCLASNLTETGAIATKSANNNPAHPHITGITVQASQLVLAPGGDSINLYDDLDRLADEHSTIFPPGTVPGHDDYLFFITAFALTGGSGPDPNGQWKLDFAADYGIQNSQSETDKTYFRLFGPPINRANCPTVDDAKEQDTTFDLNYAVSGATVVDPTNPGPGEMLMIYEGTNRCIGLKGGKTENGVDHFYASIGVATSAEYGRLWPIYRKNFSLLPADDADGPRAPEGGAFGSLVCMGYKDCGSPSAKSPSVNYGRYPVLSPTYTIKEAMADSTPLSSSMGYQAPSAFVDDIHTESGTYVYIIQNFGCDEKHCPFTSNGLTISRAKLNGGTAPLKFMSWYNGTFDETKQPFPDTQCTPGKKKCPYFTNAGLGSDDGGLIRPIFPPGPDSSQESFKSCSAVGDNGKPLQQKRMGSISYVAETKQYMLTFLCGSPRDPALAADDPNAKPPADLEKSSGQALFYSTLDAAQYDLSRQDKWSTPREITGSWEWNASNNEKGDNLSYCVNSLWYPSFMSLDNKSGYLATSGYVFSMSGCLDGWAGRERQYSSRIFTIDTAS
jgi:hypothetical protein